LGLVRFLRANCSWDRVQTAESLVPYLLEEAHEVVDAIHDRNAAALEGELGDLLLNLAFQVVIGEERGAFTASSVAVRLEEKMRRRHPHLYGLGEPQGWEALKGREREGGGVLDGLARGLDPLTAAHRIQERVSGVGFDWADYRGAFDKVGEELEEVRGALEALAGTPAGEPGGAAAESRAALEEELGDLLFAAVNLVRLAGSHPTSVLDKANRKFRRRFARLEALARERGVVLAEAGLAELDRLWDELKAEEP
jgi:MazG family protein